jgi:Cu+-exporting ATPase
MVGISVVIIACPCALALATPVATLVGLSLGAKKGILFKEAAQLETMAKVDTLVLDKTGTLTVGKPEVVKEHIYEEFDKKVLYSIVKNSNHPISKGVKEYLGSINEIVFDSYTQVPASGIVAEYKNKKFLGGNKRLMQDHNIEVDFEGTNSSFYFAVDSKIVAIYELKDKVKDDAQSLVRDLEKKGIKSIMLTGDNQSTADLVSKEVGIKEYHHSQTPQDKSDFISKLKEDGKTIVMVGDGVNDILALAHADISIVMGSGSDVAVDVSDVVLLNDSLKSLSDAFKISNTTYGLIKQNLGISLVYNAITIPLAMAGYVIPLVAAISMSLSSLLVVGNSMRIQYKWNK